jgi:dTDP-4-dehydrorhamnose reductase
LSGKRSLAEWFVNNLAAGNSIMGFTDVYFCPLLVTDLAKLLLRMLEHGLQGLYHVVSSECSNKYEFGIRLAQLFGFEETLIKPALVSESGLKAARSPKLTLRADKLINELGESTPGLNSGLEEFFAQFKNGYPDFIKGMKA